jgi:cytochrome c-type biogenesis protein CcmH
VVAAAIVAIAALVATGRDNRPATIDDRAQQVAAGLRCPVCQNLSVADSPSRLAREMRAEIEEQLRAGRTPDEVRAFFVARYGEWVLLEPTRRGLNLLPWAFPFAAVVVGVGIWVRVLRRRRRADDAAVPDPVRRRIERELASLEEAP